jgi:glycosyltransferase involved in cell wall biosynthesis
MARPAQVSKLSIVIPMLDEEAALPTLIEVLAALDPAPMEVLAVDGGSSDKSVTLAEQAGWRVIAVPRGRAVQINAGVEAARGELVCVVHADTIPPADMAKVIEQTLADPKVALAGFTPIIRGPEKTRWGTTLHNWAKTWYAPLLFHPILFARGARLLFGDHAMFFRRADFLAVGGCDPADKVMEEANLCLRLSTLGRVRLVPRVVYTSDRRIAAWGPLKANWIYFKVGMLWAMGARGKLEKCYPDVR